MKALTARQREVLDYVARYFDEHGEAPLLRETARAIGVGSESGALEHLRALVRNGYLVNDGAGKRRPYRVLRRSDGTSAGPIAASHAGLSLRRSALTARQAEVLDFLVAYVASHGRAATMRTVASGIGIKGCQGVSDHLDMLERKGRLVRHIASGGASSYTILLCSDGSPFQPAAAS